MTNSHRCLAAIGRVVAIAAVVIAGYSPALSGQMAAPPDFLTTTPSSHGFDDTVDLLKQAIEAENLMVVAEVNPQQMLRMVGVRTGGMRQILFFHPRYMKQIVETNGNGGIVPPLKILVMERPDGQVMVRYHDPVRLFEAYEGLAGLADELKGVAERVAASVR
jgi:uncharacterized protein (DUF302 family)